MRVAFHENDGNHENNENDEDNSDSYKQRVECWIRGNHGNHENDENHGNPGFPKPRVPQTTGLEIPELWVPLRLEEGKRPPPPRQDSASDFTKDTGPLYYKTPPCVFYHKNVRSKAVFGP